MSWLHFVLLLFIGRDLSAQIHSVTVSTNRVTIQGEAIGTGRLLEFFPEETLAANAKGILVELIQQPGTYKVSVSRQNEGRDRIYSAFKFVPSDPNQPESQLTFATGLSKISRWQQPFPVVQSKKGLQVQMLEDAISLGVRHAALNVDLANVLARKGETRTIKKRYGTNDIALNESYLLRLDQQIRTLSQAGATVSLIILYYKSDDTDLNRAMLHPNYNEASPNRLSAFNTRTAQGVLHYVAALEQLAERYSSPPYEKGRVINYIIGNEVNSHWFWYNMGRVAMKPFADDYLLALRLANTAVRKYSSTSRVYVSLEHHWNVRYPGGDELQTFKGKELLEYFASQAKKSGDFDWHLAFHPYPENLFKAATWNDTTALPSLDTPRITFKNIEILGKFLEQPSQLFEGKRRRVILSEQGFHSDGTEQGEKIQAAAYCYAYQKIRNLDWIDSFILHRHVDHKHEGGLNLGLWRRKPESVATPDTKKPIYDVFKAADKPGWEKAFDFALPIIGIKSWEDF